MAEPTKEKLVWIDFAKVIGAMSVVYNHAGGTLGPLMMSFMMPFFFATSGYFAGRRYVRLTDGNRPHKTLQFLDIGRCARLGIATIFWATAFVFIVRWNEIAGLFSQFDTTRLISLLKCCLTLPSQPENGPLWFLRDLAMISLIGPLLFRIRSGWALLALVALLALPVAPYLNWSGSFGIPICLLEFLNGLLFFWSGICAAKSPEVSTMIRDGLDMPRTVALSGVSVAIYTGYWFFGGGYGIGVAILGLFAFCATSCGLSKFAPQGVRLIAKGASLAFLCFVSHYIVIVKLGQMGFGIKGVNELTSIVAALGLFYASYLIRLPFLILGSYVSSLLLLHPVRSQMLTRPHVP